MRTKNKFSVNLLGCLAILSIIFTMANPARAQEKSSTPDFEFSDNTKLTLDPKKPADIFILNTTALSFSIQVWVTDFGFEPLNGHNIENAITLKDETGQPITSILLKPAESKRLIVEASASELAKVKPGTYTAFLVAYEPNASGKVIRRELEVMVKVGVEPNPLVEKWTLRAVRNNVFSDIFSCSPACYLPLQTPTGEMIMAEGLDKQLGVLVAEEEEPVIVKGSAATEESNGITRLPLLIENLKNPGTYTGTLDLLPDDEGTGTVEVTLNATDAWWWPFLALLGGILIAILAQLFEAIGRKIWILKYRRETISPGDEGSKDGKKYAEAKQTFCNNIAKTKTAQDAQAKFKNFSDCLKKDLELRVGNLKEPIQALWSTPTPVLDEQNKDYKAVLDELDFIESQLEVWKEFGAHWAQAYEAIEKFKEEFKARKPQWPLIEGKFPNFVETAETYWDEDKKKTGIKLAELAVLDDRLQKAKTLAEQWGELQREVDIYQGYIQHLYVIEMPKEYKEDLYAADRLINQAWAELWLAKDADDLKEMTTKTDIDHVEELILGLYRFYFEQNQVSEDIKGADKENYLQIMADALGLRKVGGFQIPGNTRALMNESIRRMQKGVYLTEPKLAFTTLVDRFQRLRLTIKDRVLPAEDHILMARRYVAARIMREVIFAAVALGLAALTGMTALYFGKNFGSVQDYLSIGTWGLVTKGALEGLNTAIDKLRGFSKA